MAWVACAAYVLLVLGVVTEEPLVAVEHWLYVVVFALAAGLCFLRARRHGTEAERWAWVAFGAGMSASAIGWILYWVFVERLDPIPYPSPSDGLWLLGYAINYVALILLMRARVRRHAPHLWIDGLIGVLALAALSAGVVFEPMLEATGGSTRAVVVNLAYPVADLVVLAMVVTMFALSGWRPDRSLGLIGIAFLLQTVADSVYLSRAAAGTYVPGTLLDAAWPVAALLIAWAAWMPGRRVGGTESDGWRMFVVPGLFSAMAFGVVVYGNLVGIPLAATFLATLALVAVSGRSAVRYMHLRRLARSHEEAVGASLTDSLTGLRNHRAFHEDLGTAIRRHTASEEPLTLVLLDLVGLKLTNDTLGHQAGDRRLQAFARQLSALMRRGDYAYRVGGDEFAVILSSAGAWDGFNFAERAQIELSGGYAKTAPAMSAGIAELAAGMGKDDLIRGADLALIEAKRSSRKAVVYSPALERELEPTATDAEGRRHTKALATSLARAVDAKDSYTRSHCETVAESCVLIGEQLGLEPERVGKLRLAGLLHDVGKIGIPDSILQKPGPLSEEEYERMKTHSRLGHDIVSAAGLEEEAEWILHHHERMDGRGYPEGLSAEEVPLESRIILVADAFEAMTSDRPYRQGRPVPEAVAELRREAGTQFDQDCVRALEAAVGARPRALTSLA